jgi:hypothetical protein
MSLKQRATIVENTGGQLKYLHNPTILVDDNGLNIDFTDTEKFVFEDNRLKCSHLEIFNLGPSKCMIAFDTHASLINYLDRLSFNFWIYPGKPFNYISLDGEADTMSLKTNTILSENTDRR